MPLTQINNTVSDTANLTANNASFLGGTSAASYALGTTVTTANTAMKGYVDAQDSTKANLSGALFAGNISTTANVKFTGWQIYEQGTLLYFAYNGVNKMSLNTSGNLTVSGDVVGFGTP